MCRPIIKVCVLITRYYTFLVLVSYRTYEVYIFVLLVIFIIFGLFLFFSYVLLLFIFLHILILFARFYVRRLSSPPLILVLSLFSLLPLLY